MKLDIALCAEELEELEGENFSLNVCTKFMPVERRTDGRKGRKEGNKRATFLTSNSRSSLAPSVREKSTFSEKSGGGS